MINALLAINADLASSIAFRYACRLAEVIDMRLETIHIEAAAKEKYPPGSGWVRSTWEAGLLQSARETINQLINTEKNECPALGTSIVRIGDREDELLGEIQKKSYDLLLEGILEDFDAHSFHQRIRSKLYRYAPCPIILVKNLAHPDRVALLLQDAEDVVPVVSTFMRLFDPSKTAVAVCHCSFTANGQAPARINLAEDPQAGEAAAGRLIDDAVDLLAANGWEPESRWIFRDRPKRIGAGLDDYGLVGARMPLGGHDRGSFTDMLSRVPSATLLVS